MTKEWDDTNWPPAQDAMTEAEYNHYSRKLKRFAGRDGSEAAKLRVGLAREMGMEVNEMFWKAANYEREQSAVARPRG